MARKTHTVTVEEYFAGYPKYTPTQEERSRAVDLLRRVNELLGRSVLAGVKPLINPVTNSRISGTKNGGFRLDQTTVGAANSQHKQARGIDIYDPYRELADWCYAHRDTDLAEIGLWMEDPRWTPTWVHLQSVPPGSGRRVFVPSTAAPLAAPVPSQRSA